MHLVAILVQIIASLTFYLVYELMLESSMCKFTFKIILVMQTFIYLVCCAKVDGCFKKKICMGMHMHNCVQLCANLGIIRPTDAITLKKIQKAFPKSHLDGPSLRYAEMQRLHILLLQLQAITEFVTTRIEGLAYIIDVNIDST